MARAMSAFIPTNSGNLYSGGRENTAIQSAAPTIREVTMMNITVPRANLRNGEMRSSGTDLDAIFDTPEGAAAEWGPAELPVFGATLPGGGVVLRSTPLYIET